MTSSKKMALTLTGGGARGSYQAGVVAGLLEICAEENRPFPFKIFVGTSAGAINASYLASKIKTLNGLELGNSIYSLWGDLTSSHIYKTGTLQLAGNTLKWARGLTGGGHFRGRKNLSLLDTSPLSEFLDNIIDFKQLNDSLLDGTIEGLAITALCYNNNTTTTFFQSSTNAQPWKRKKRIGIENIITKSHIHASSAIPFLFPSIKLDSHYYGDGSVRNYAPLGPGIKLGAEKLFVVGVKRVPNENTIFEGQPGPARIFGTLLNGLLMDALDLDFERLDRINKILSSTTNLAQENLKPIEYFTILPSEDLGLLAEKHIKLLPPMVRYLLKGLGSAKEVSEIASYILFESSYTKLLLNLGIKDVKSQKDKILEFFDK